MSHTRKGRKSKSFVKSLKCKTNVTSTLGFTRKMCKQNIALQRPVCNVYANGKRDDRARLVCTVHAVYESTTGFYFLFLTRSLLKSSQHAVDIRRLFDKTRVKLFRVRFVIRYHKNFMTHNNNRSPGTRAAFGIYGVNVVSSIHTMTIKQCKIRNKILLVAVKFF